MEQAIRLLRELRASASATEGQVDRFLQTCRELKLPRVTIFVPVEQGWWDMQGAYVFTKRTDAHEFIWHYSGSSGLKVWDREGQHGVPLNEWDPEADLFVHDSLYDGGTNMDPVERMRRGIVSA